METVFIAMSGGMDSSFAAYLLKVQGYKVVGFTFQLLPASLRNTRNPKACCSIETIGRAKRIAEELEIPHYVINLRDEFEEHVIENFINEYREGRTPNPCVLCNKHIKFSAFLRKALSMGAERVATGHYGVIEETSGEYLLRRSPDKVKDQSYFLYPVKKELLPYILFPVGNYTKAHLRERVPTNTAWGLKGVKESQDICFIPEGDYREFLSGFVGLTKGPVYLFDGTLLGRHQGIHLHTVGQRRGLGIPYREPLYVLEVRARDNSLVVGPKRCLRKKKLVAHSVNLLYQPTGGTTGKVRYRQAETPCTYTVSNDRLEVNFLEPVDSVTPGQSVVLYSEGIVVGGGIIEQAENS
jgi:tRNA-uridine 2-sulfurtransferase